VTLIDVGAQTSDKRMTAFIVSCVAKKKRGLQ
jgi:hypothetical protein